jgi:ATP-binding cassette subfamily C protein
VDLVGVMEAGRIKALGPRDEIMKPLMKRPAAPAPAAAPAPFGTAFQPVQLREVRQ